MNPAAFGAAPGACALGTQGTQGPDRITHNVYDAAGQLLQVQGAYGVTTANGFPETLQQNEATYTYSPNGRRQTVTDGNGNASYFHYDGHDRLQYWVMPSATATGYWNWANIEYYGYDAVGNRTLLVKRDGSTLNYVYDGLNRLIVKIVPERAGLDPSNTRDVHYAYDLRNQQTEARFDSLAGDGVSNVYDAFGRLTSSTTRSGALVRTLSYEYDIGGRRTRITHPDGQAFTYGYSPAGELTGIYQGIGTSVPLDTFAYDAQARLGSRSEGAGGSGVGYTYDAAGRLASLTDNLAGGTGNVALTLGYNPASQIVSQTRTNDAYAWTGAYNVNRTYTVNGLNQYSTAGPTTFAYDANGNLASETTASVTRAYTYDVENRLVAASGPSPGSGGSGVQLGYDPLGRLAWTTGSPNFTRFLYDGDALVAEYDYSGILARRYVHGGNAADDPLVWYEGAGLTAPQWLHADHQGSIVAIANGAGALASINAYDEYGIPNGGNQGRFQYTGQAWLAELGMYHYKARIYSPTLGRFLQTDPVGYEGGLNLYAYVGNDPVNSTDPSGTVRCNTDPRCQEVHAAAAEARGAAMRASADLRGIAAARASGTELTSEQEGVVSAYERRFGAGSATASHLNSAARHLDRVANKIGAEGSGLQVRFRTTAQLNGAIASTTLNGNRIDVGPRFFGQDGGMNGLSQPLVILHEGGHGAGLEDIIMPRGAPSNLGRPWRGQMRAYGTEAADWLGAHARARAAINNDNYNCFVIPACGGN